MFGRTSECSLSLLAICLIIIGERSAIPDFDASFLGLLLSGSGRQRRICGDQNIVGKDEFDEERVDPAVREGGG